MPLFWYSYIRLDKDQLLPATPQLLLQICDRFAWLNLTAYYFPHYFIGERWDVLACEGIVVRAQRQSMDM